MNDDSRSVGESRGQVTDITDRTEEGAEGAGGLRLQWQVFAGIGAFIAAITILYWFTSYEDTGSVLLLLSAGLAGFAAVYLWLQERRLSRPEEAEAPDQHDGYLPHASIWPFGIGVAAVLMANGLILGVLFLVPGLVVLAISVVGFTAQTRRRD